MQLQRLLHASTVLASFLGVFLWKMLNLGDITIPAVGLLIIIYFIISKRSKEPSKESTEKINLFSVFLVTTLILLVISATGGLVSPLFFLLFFLSFVIAFLLLPETVIPFVLGVMIFFLPEAMAANTTENLLKIGSILLIAPLSFFFGKEYRDREKEKDQIRKAATTIEAEAIDLLQQKDADLNLKEKAELTDIIAESEELKKV
jgi:membrane-associated HD superfamily phosphohydrolase